MDLTISKPVGAEPTLKIRDLSDECARRAGG